MKKGNEVFIGIDTAEVHNTVAVAEAGCDGAVRYLGTFDNTPDAVVRLVRKLARRYEALHFCCEAGSTGHGLYRQILPYHGAKATVFAPCKQLRNEGAICACRDGAKPVKKSMGQNLTGEMSFATMDL